MRVFLADDEPLAREGMRIRLAEAPDVEVVGEAATGLEAIEGVLRERPDLLFLDVEMPERNGFAVIDAIAPVHRPRVVFVTAFDHYAIRAFEAHAVDYLLKPVSEARLNVSLERARHELAIGNAWDAAAKLNALLESRPEPTDWLRRLTVADGDRVVFLKVEEVDWIGAAGNYVELHLGARTLLLRETLSELACRLDPARFARIHRSTIVNLDRVREMVPDWHGDGEVVLHSGLSLRMSRSYRRGLIDAPRSRGA